MHGDDDDDDTKIIGTVELRSKGFHGTGLNFPADWNSFIVNVDMNS